MADALPVQLWKDITDQLNTKQGAWSLPFTAKRYYQPKTKLEETDQVVVQTAFAAWRVAPDNRTDWEHQYDIDIGVMLRPKATAGDQPHDKYDACLKLAEEITDYWEDTRPTIADCPLTAIAFGPAGDAPYIPEHIETHNQFTTVIRLTFQKLR